MTSTVSHLLARLDDRRTMCGVQRGTGAFTWLPNAQAAIDGYGLIICDGCDTAAQEAGTPIYQRRQALW